MLFQIYNLHHSLFWTEPAQLKARVECAGSQICFSTQQSIGHMLWRKHVSSNLLLIHTDEVQRHPEIVWGNIYIWEAEPDQLNAVKQFLHMHCRNDQTPPQNTVSRSTSLQHPLQPMLLAWLLLSFEVGEIYLFSSTEKSVASLRPKMVLNFSKEFRHPPALSPYSSCVVAWISSRVSICSTYFVYTYWPLLPTRFKVYLGLITGIFLQVHTGNVRLCSD